MRIRRAMAWAAALLGAALLLGQHSTLQEQNETLFRQLQQVHGLSDAQMSAIRKIFAKSGYMGQGNPAVTQHPVTPEEAQAKLKRLGIDYANPKFEKICEGKYMAPLYDPAKQRPEDAKDMHRSV